MRSFPYILGNYLLDFLLFMIPTIGFIILLLIMQIDSFISQIGNIIALLSCFGLAMIPMTYIVSYVFSSNNDAFRYVGVIYIFIGFMVPVVIGSVLLVAKDKPTMVSVISGILFLDPFYPLYQGLQLIAYEGNNVPNLENYFPGFLP